jgi:uncharacterized protein YfbU (UPF0304 family)|tara:strand:- start:172 stop:384 length:213 start_codon:yes stop_codon:yes gene_type:complete
MTELNMSPSLKRFIGFSIKKSEKYIKYMRFLENELQYHSDCLALIMEHQELLKNGKCPTLQELKEWNIID